MTEKHWKFKNDRKWTDDEITQLIMDEVGKDVIRPTGSLLLVKLCERPEKTAGGIILSHRELDIFNVRIGRVLDMGNHCYDKERFPNGPFCHIGDYITFPQYNWERCPVEHITLFNIPCNKVSNIVPGPDGLVY